MTEEPPKQPSGAAGRRKKYERENAAAPPDDGAWAEGFVKAGEPDLENPDTDLSYVRKLQLIVLSQMSTTPNPSIQQQACWRRIREMSAVVGMTSSRASLESKVKALKKQLDDRNQLGTIREEKGKGFSKPPTARGQKTTPRVVKDEAPDEPK